MESRAQQTDTNTSPGIIILTESQSILYIYMNINQADYCDFLSLDSTVSQALQHGIVEDKSL